MATSGMDRRIKIFDLRMYKELSKYQYHHKQCPGLLDFSQKGLLAVTRDNVVEVWKHLHTNLFVLFCLLLIYFDLIMSKVLSGGQ